MHEQSSTVRLPRSSCNAVLDPTDPDGPRCRSSRGTECRRGNAPARCGTECIPPPGTRLWRGWQKDLTAFRRPFKPPRRGSTPDRERRSADRPAGRPAIGLTSLAMPSDLRVPARSSTHAPSSSRSCERSPGARAASGKKRGRGSLGDDASLRAHGTEERKREETGESGRNRVRTAGLRAVKSGC